MQRDQQDAKRKRTAELPREGVEDGAAEPDLDRVATKEPIESGVAASGEESDASDSDDEMACSRCSCQMNASRMLLCDGASCTAAYHIYCLQPPLSEVPDGAWFCPACALQPAAERIALEQELGWDICGVNGCILKSVPQ